MADESKYYLPEGLPSPRAPRTGLDKEFWEPPNATSWSSRAATLATLSNGDPS